MKKLKVLLIMVLSFFPGFVFAYSSYIIPGGESIGINIKTNGVLVVGFYKINGSFNKGSPNLKAGDIIVKVGEEDIYSENDLVNSIQKYMDNNEVEITLRRNKQTIKATLPLIYSENTYKTGLYIKDNITGIGTLSYIDPETNIFGALGHEVDEKDTNQKIEVKEGKIYESAITSIDRSVRGTVGAKNAKLFDNNIFGNINKNSLYGIYGNYTSTIDTNSALEIKSIKDAHLGEAYIYTVIDGNKKEKFMINITKLDKNSKLKNIFFTITDENLISASGGVVQGMSGSPIIQDNMLIGVVTHAVVSDPKSGYGIDIISMLEEGEK